MLHEDAIKTGILQLSASLEPYQVNFVLSIVGYVVSGLLVVVWWFAKEKIARLEECTRHLEAKVDTHVAAYNLFLTAYTERHGELRGRIGTVEGDLRGFKERVNNKIDEIPTILYRLQSLDKIVERARPIGRSLEDRER